MELIAEFINDCCFDDLKDIKDIVHQYIVDLEMESHHQESVRR